MAQANQTIQELYLPQGLVTDIPGGVFALPYRTDKVAQKARIVLEWHLFNFLMEGEKAVSYASGTQRLGAEGFFFLPAGNCLMSEKTADNGRYSCMLLFVSQQSLYRFFQDHPFDDVPAESTDPTPVAFLKDAYIANFIHSLQLMQPHYHPALYENKLHELLLYLTGKNKQLIAYFKGLCNEYDEETQLRKIVNTHLESAITVEELAFLCNMSISTFKRKFARVFGDSPKQWLLKMRMQKAAALLKNKGLKASDVYYDLGYENLSSFVQSFKQVHGITPKQYQLSN